MVKKHRTIMIHRACFGSMERFIGILTEHYAGAFPTWMAPVQVKILPISEKHVEYAKELAKQMHHDYVSRRSDDRSEKNRLQKSAKHKWQKFLTCSL